MDGAFIGLLTGGVIVLSGLLLLWRPDLMSPFIFMSKAELDKAGREKGLHCPGCYRSHLCCGQLGPECFRTC